MIDIKMVIHKLKAMITLTMPGGSQSNKMVFGLNRSTNIQTMNIIDNRMAPTPATTEPHRNDRQPRQLLNIGLAIFVSIPWRFYVFRDYNLDKSGTLRF